ncbi:MAG: hypothetical protein ACI84C_000229 [Flavobacteriales bacterium]|jgi:hypothetical protein
MGKFTSFISVSPRIKTSWVLFVGVLILHLCLLPWVQNYDADSVTRILIGRDLLDNPQLIPSGIWVPGQFYLTALSMLFWDNLIWAPKVLHVIIGSLVVFPVYQFSKRRLDKTASIGIALFIALCPIIFRNSYHALAGIPFVLLTALTLVRIDKIIYGERQLVHVIWAGVFMTIAASMRYEAWMLMAIFTGILLLKREWKLSVVFSCVAGVFPLLWMIGNFVDYGDPMYFLEGVKIWNLGNEGVNDLVTEEEMAKRHVFFLYSFGFVLSPWIVVVAFFSPLVHWIKSKKRDSALLLTIPFIIFFVVFVIKAGHGTLLTQHRFTCALVVLFIPFLRYLGQLIHSRIYLFVLMATASFMWFKAFNADEVHFEKHFPGGIFHEGVKMIGDQASGQLKPVPRLLGKRGERVTNDVLTFRQEGEPIVVDFLSWSDSYFILLRLSEYTDRNVMIVDCGDKQVLNEEAIVDYISGRSSAIFVVGENGKFKEHYDGDFMTLGGQKYEVTHLSKHWKTEVVRITAGED